MSHINLLPWRDKQRQQQKKQYLLLLAGVALLSMVVMYGISMLVERQINQQRERNQHIQQQIQILDIKIAKIKNIREQKSAIVQRMALVEQLQASRNVTPQVLDELARIVPRGIAFQSLSRTGNQLEVLGSSDSNNRLADFMRRIEQSEVFVDGELSSIVADTSASDAVSEFKLTFSISPLIAPPSVTSSQPEAGQ